MNGNEVLQSVGSSVGFCSHTASLWQLVGTVLLIFKIVIPIILIVLGMIDFGKAVISSDDKAISKSAKSLMFRIIAAVVIFFIPTLISFVFSVIAQFSDVQEDFEVCKLCITKPTQSADKEGSCKYIISNSAE